MVMSDADGPGEMIKVNSKGGFSPAEAFVIDRERLSRRAPDLDPNVRARIERGSSISAADYIEMQRERAMLVRAMDDRIAGFDALILPATPIVAPRIAEVATPETFAPKNTMLLRNTSLVNFFDLCAISLPLPRGSGLPAGLMLAARNGADWRLLRITISIERQPVDRHRCGWDCETDPTLTLKETLCCPRGRSSLRPIRGAT
jgi:aspartyl-tRNA(Asn)/glutamyl-tRNA(Gln) amidotransferase subunit A